MHIVLRIVIILVKCGYRSSRSNIVADHLWACPPTICARKFRKMPRQRYAFVINNVVLAGLRPGSMCDIGNLRIIEVNDEARWGLKGRKWPHEVARGCTTRINEI